MRSGSDAAETPVVTSGSLRLLFRLVVMCGLALCGIGAWWRDLDFAGGVLLGFLIVALNLVWTRRLVESLLIDKKPRALVSVSFVIKFALTAGVLYLAIVRFQVDPLGVLAGLSTLLLAALCLVMYLGWRRG